MAPEQARPPAERRQPASSTIDTVIRISLIGLVAYWSLQVIGPFLSIGLWSAILAVALYPLFEWLADRTGSRRLAAIAVTLVSLVIVVGPVTWLGLGLVHAAESLVRKLDANSLALPLPPDTVREWPLIGEQLYRLWSLAATDLRAILPDAVPTLKPIGEKLLGLAGTVGLGLLEFVAAIIVAGFLYGPAPRMVEILRNGLRKVSGARGEEMLKLAGATIRNVSRGIVGVATIQALLAGIGFAAAGMRSAGFLTFVALMLGLVQLGASVLIIPVILWSWATMATTKALIFTAYMIPVSILDNVLKPLLMARGLEAPMPVILVGVIGGTIAYGMSGLFLGPIMLSVAWVLMIAWTRDDPSPPENA